VGCILIVLSAFAPRLVLFLVWLFGGGWITAPFSTWIWPLLGFFLMPVTTLAYAFSWHQTGGNVGGGWIVLIVVAVLMDMSMLGGGANSMRDRGKE